MSPRFRRSPAPPDATHLVGSLAGEAIDQQLPFTGAAVAAIGPRMRLGDDGFVALRAAGVLGLETDEPVHGVGVGRMPTAGPASGAYFCAGASSTYESMSDGLYQMRLQEVAIVGTCDGDPVEGEIEVCFGHAACGSPAFAASLEGNAFERGVETRLAGFGTLDGSLVAEFDLVEAASLASTGDAGIVWLDAAGASSEPAGIQQATVTEARLVMPLGAPDAGAIYCASAGTLLYEFVDPFEFDLVSATLSQVRRVGACEAGGDDVLDACGSG